MGNSGLCDGRPGLWANTDGALIKTDSTAPLVMYTNKAARDKYRRRVQSMPGFISSAAHEIQWSSHEEHHALNHLSRHARAISLQRGWTDHGPPVEAMAYRKFRRSFAKAAILDMPPPKGMYMSAYEKAQKPRWSSQTSARTHTSREERARNERARTSQANRRSAHRSHLDSGEHVPISAAMQEEADGVEPVADLEQHNRGYVRTPSVKLHSRAQKELSVRPVKWLSIRILPLEMKLKILNKSQWRCAVPGLGC